MITNPLPVAASPASTSLDPLATGTSAVVQLVPPLLLYQTAWLVLVTVEVCLPRFTRLVVVTAPSMTRWPADEAARVIRSAWPPGTGRASWLESSRRQVVPLAESQGTGVELAR